MTEIDFEKHHYGGTGSGIPFVYAFDSDFAKYAAVSAYSLHRTSKTPPRVYWIVTQESFQKMEATAIQMEKHNIDLTVIIVADDMFSEWKYNNQYTQAMYLRFLIPYVLEDEKAVYIDCDTLVMSDMQELASVDIKGLPLGGVIDPGGWSSKLKFAPGEPYINSGLLVMNLEYLRNDNFLVKCEEIYDREAADLRYPDQDILNRYAEEKKLVLDPKWNSMVASNQIIPSEWMDVMGSAKMIHFYGPVKPWMGWCNPVTSYAWWTMAELADIGAEMIPRKTVLDYHRFANTLALTSNLVDAYNISMHIMEMMLNEKATKDTEVVLPFDLNIPEHMKC